MVKAVFPGTFDPVTNGHIDMVERSNNLFDEIVVGVYRDPPKGLIFNVDERVFLFKKALSHMPEVEVRPYQGLTVKFARDVGAKVVVRGLRIGNDFEYEREMALMNRVIDADIEIACLLSSLEYQFVSSTRVKEIAALGGNIERFVPKSIAGLVNERMAIARKC
jgi:pantetheine-phosphate adenylyltransferase